MVCQGKRLFQNVAFIFRVIRNWNFAHFCVSGNEAELISGSTDKSICVWKQDENNVNC